jgi:hypothetical protein
MPLCDASMQKKKKRKKKNKKKTKRINSLTAMGGHDRQLFIELLW